MLRLRIPDAPLVFDDLVRGEVTFLPENVPDFALVRANGDLMQDGTTKDMVFDVPALVSYVSSVMTLLPGDVILTGTPEGVGPMQVGDEVEITVAGIGSLTNKVVSRD